MVSGVYRWAAADLCALSLFVATEASPHNFIVYGRGKPAQTYQAEHEVLLKPPERLNITDQYMGLLLLVLVKAGLLDVCPR